MQSKFNLDSLIGQRIRIRWIASAWQFDDVTSSYFEYGTGWSDTPHDDGWWLDDIKITGALEGQFTPTPDLSPPPATNCPSTAADNCNEDAAGADRGTFPQIKMTDLNGNAFGPALSPVAGQSILVSAADSTIPGGCSGGAAQFRFSKDGVVVQDWNGKAFFLDTPGEYSPTYSVLMRCGSDTSCTSLIGASVKVAIYDGVNTESDGDVVFGTQANPFDPNAGVLYDGATLTTTLNLVSAGGSGPVDVYKGTITPSGTGNGFMGAGPGWQHVATSCFLNSLSVVATNATSGALDQAADPDPAVGTATFYLANAAPANVLSGAFGCVNPGRCYAGPTPNAACGTNAECGAGGTCMNLGQAGPLQSDPLGTGFGCPIAGNSPYRVIGSATPASAASCQP